MGRVSASISLRNSNGISFGTLLKVRGDRMAVEADGTYDPNAILEFQLELVGFNTTVYGEAEVIRAKTARGTMNKYELGITQMKDYDRRLYETWVDESTRGGSVTVPERPGPSSDLNSVISGITSTTRSSRSSATLDTMSRPRGASTYTSQARPGVGREAIREALRRQAAPRPVEYLGRQSNTARRGEDLEYPGTSSTITTRSSTSASATRPSPTTTSQATPASPSTDPGGRREHVDPKVSYRRDTEPMRLGLKYGSRSTYFSDYQSYLSKSACFIKTTAHGMEEGRLVDLRIKLPSGMMVRCDAKVVVCLPTGFGLSLELDEENRLVLGAASKV